MLHSAATSDGNPSLNAASPTLILHQHPNPAADDAAIKTPSDSDATTVDDQHADPDSDDAFQDSADSSQEDDRLKNVLPTLILESQQQQHLEPHPTTQLLLEHDDPTFPPSPGPRATTSEPNRSMSSVRVQSLRNSALAAYQKLVTRLASEPPVVLEDSAKLVLEWGRKQGLPAPDIITRSDSYAEENYVLGEASCSAALVTTPITKPVNALSAMCSNNKKSTGLERPVDAVSPGKPESTLDRVRKVLFEADKVHQPVDLVVGVVHGEPVRRPMELSFLNSQEPGEESQANALEALDKLISVNCADMSQNAEVDEFTVEAKKTPNFLSGLAQLQKVESATVFDFVNSQENPLVTNPAVEKNAVQDGEQNRELQVENVTEKADEQGEKADVQGEKANKEGNSAVRSRNSKAGVTTPRPSSTKRQAQTSPEENPRGKRRKKSSTEAPAHQVVFAAAPESSPVTPRNATNGTVAKAANPKSTSRKRKTSVEKLILTDDTPRRCRRKPVKILFSHSMDKDTVEHQNKTVRKLNFQVVTKASACTHFVTDRFLRTANMLEVLAAGKPVVTIAWLESCRIAGCAVDEKKFIMEDSKKEKELGFCMLTTFSLAQQKLLLEGMRVYITPNTKPDIVVALVRAAGGKVLKKYDATDENCFVISCEEDHDVCLPLLNKDVKIYSTEFLFNSIVSYHLDFSKNLLFTDHDPVL